LGEHLLHSFSPVIHAEFGDYEYKLYEKKPDELDLFFRQRDFDGLNVTIPYKKTVIKYCDSLSDKASAAGSVNTITQLPDGSLRGDTTDFFGFDYLLKKTGINPNAGKVIILGSGGSSLTVQTVLRDAGAMDVVIVSRSGASNYDNIHMHSDAVLIINTTPVGMFPNNGVSPLTDLGMFRDCKAVIDLIYNPHLTKLLFQAEECGILGAGGLPMLVAQAKKSAELFMRVSIPDSLIESTTLKIERLTQNIILIGMPGCGKSSIGEALAKKMDREFADTDKWVEESAGKPVPAIIKEDGEDAFRNLESDALKALCKRSGLVIATGGGVIKREENRNVIRQNGVTFFLDRDLSRLPVTGRPLSESEGIQKLAAERLPIYSQWGNYTVNVNGIDQTAESICAMFQGGAFS